MIKLNNADQLDLIYRQVTSGVRCDSNWYSVKIFLEVKGLSESTEGKSEEEGKKIDQKNIEEAKNIAKQIAVLRQSDTECASALAKHLNIDVAQLTTSPNGKLILEFFRRLPDWYHSNGSDCTECFYLGDEAIASVKSGYGVSRDEFLLFKRDTSFWSNDNQGLVMTDLGIHVVPDNDDDSQSFVLEWQAIEAVTYKETKFYFTMHDGSEPYIEWKNFFKGDFPGKESCENLANVLTDMAKIVEVVPDAWELFNSGRIDDALSSCNSLIASGNTSEQINGHFTKGRILFEIENAKNDPDAMDESKLAESQKELETAYKMDEDNNEKAIIQYWLAPVKVYQGDITARDSFILGMEAEDNDMKDDAFDSLQRLEDFDSFKELWNNYVTEEPYKKRKFIMPVKDKEIAGCVADGINVFRMSNIPSCIKFPMGHPIANQLYIGHPYNPQLYVPYEESEDLFFVDKVHEMCYLLECLGAEEISITSVKGKSVEEMNCLSGSAAGSADVKLFSGEGTVQQTNSTEQQSKDVTHRTMKMVFSPTCKPYVPEGLIWYEEQPQWKRLVQSRINGNMLEYNEFVSSSSTKFVSSSEKSDVSASARYIWMKVHTDVSTATSTQLRDTEDTQWKVEVRFRSTDLLNDAPVQSKETSAPTQEPTFQDDTTILTQDESKYLEEVKFCLADDEGIDASARKFLDRLCKRYNISTERAAEIEDMVKPKLSDDEKEYLDSVKEVLVDGEMSPRDRKLLNRLRDSLGISEERAAELEKSV